MGQHHLADADAVLQLDALTGQFILVELYLQQVVVQRNACLDGRPYVFLDAFKIAAGGIDSVEFLLELYQLPEILLGGMFHFACGQLSLQLAGFYSDLG